MQRGNRIQAAGKKPVFQRHAATEDTGLGTGSRSLPVRDGKDDAAALGRIGDAVQIAEGIGVQQAGRGGRIAAQHPDPALPVADGDGGLEIEKLLPRPVTVVVIGAVQDQQMARPPQRIVDVAHELRASGKIVVLDRDGVALAFKNVRDFLGHIRDGAAAADKILEIERRLIHRGTPRERCQRGTGRPPPATSAWREIATPVQNAA